MSVSAVLALVLGLLLSGSGVAALEAPGHDPSSLSTAEDDAPAEDEELPEELEPFVDLFGPLFVPLCARMQEDAAEGDGPPGGDADAVLLGALFVACAEVSPPDERYERYACEVDEAVEEILAVLSEDATALHPNATTLETVAAMQAAVRQAGIDPPADLAGMAGSEVGCEPEEADGTVRGPDHGDDGPAEPASPPSPEESPSEAAGDEAAPQVEASPERSVAPRTGTGSPGLDQQETTTHPDPAVSEPQDDQDAAASMTPQILAVEPSAVFGAPQGASLLFSLLLLLVASPLAYWVTSRVASASSARP